MTTVTIDTTDEDAVEDHPRRIALITLAVLLPTEFNDADLADIVPKALTVTGYADVEVTDFFQVTVQDARLVMT